MTGAMRNFCSRPGEATLTLVSDHLTTATDGTRANNG